MSILSARLLRALVVCVLGIFPILRAGAATFTVSGTTLQLNLTAANESVAITAGAGSYTFALTGGTWSGTDSADATGNGTATLSALKASFTAVTVDDGSTGNAVTFNTSGANTYVSTFTVTLDHATAGTITFNGNTAFTGSSAFSASTSRNMVVASGAVVSVVNGNLTLSANQQVTPTNALFHGIQFNGTVTTSGTGNVFVAATSGNNDVNIGIAMDNGIASSTATGAGAGTVTLNGKSRGIGISYAVEMKGASTISSVSGDISVTGTNNSNGASNAGIYMQSTSSIRSTGTGATAAKITIVGTGSSQASGTTNEGVAIRGLGIFTVDGDVSITGTGRSAAAESDGVSLKGSAVIRSTGSGNIRVTGTGAATGTTASGILVTGKIESLGTGTTTLTGTGTTAAGITLTGGTVGSISSAAPISLISDTLAIDGTANVLASSAGSVTIAPLTSGRGIDLGGADSVSNLGLTNAELGRVQAGGLTIGSASTGSISLSANLSLSLVSAVNLTASTINLAGFTLTAPAVWQTIPGQPGISVSPPVGAFGIVPQGATQDIVFKISNVGFVNLSDISVSLTGADQDQFSVITSPAATVAAGGSTTFMIRYTPTRAGTKIAAVQIASNDPDENPAIINLNRLPDIAVEQPAGTAVADGGTTSFGGVSVGSTADLVFTVKNPGVEELAISSITFDGINAGEFSVFAAPASTVPASGSTTFTVRHTPTTIGSKVAALHIASSVPGTKNPYDINLTASSLPNISVEEPAGTAIADGGTKGFGGVQVGSTANLVFTVKNPGVEELAISAITFDGTHASEFSVFSAPASTVPAGGSTTFSVRYAPTSFGSKTAALHIASNVPGGKNPYDINFTAFGASPPISGTKAVGPTGDYTSLTQAITDIQNAGLAGPLLLELQPAYLSSVETFPLVLGNLGTTATNTLTIRPASGATGLSISSANTTAATVDLNGAQFVTIDGRPGGVGSHAGSGFGTASQLTIENTSTSGVALRFINEASSNTIRYTTLRGVNTSSTSGTVFFFITTGANGNDNNTIDHCDIRDGAGTPANGIYSFGTAAPADNSGNTVTNCNFFNFHNASGTAYGVQLGGGNTGWTISGNSFYQTANRAESPGLVAVRINNSSGNNFTVAGNFIGGTAPNAGGTPWTTTGTATANRFQGIALTVGTTTPSNVQGNTIANMVWTSSSAGTALAGVWTGIYVTAGNVNIGTVTGNTIGSGTGTGSISVITSGSGGTSFGIGASGTGAKVIANNTIGSITVNGSTPTVSASLTGIQMTAGANTTNTIRDNTVGSTSTANSLNAATSSTSAIGQQVTGILSSSDIARVNITGNTVANLNNNYDGTATSGQIRGIVTSLGLNTITGNTVRNLATTSRNPSQSVTAITETTGTSVVGIAALSTTAAAISTTVAQTVSQNTVHSLANTAVSSSAYVTGIYFAGPTSGLNVIAGNFVHSLELSTTSSTSAVTGMQFHAGTFTARNNMVRVGLKADGTGTAGASLVRGILDIGTTAGRNFYHNSVYLGGTRTSGVVSSYAFFSTGVSNTRTFRNNIFVNARSNNGGTGKHYAVSYGGTTVNPTGLTAGGNLFLASGIGGVFGLYNAVDRSDLAAWQAATGQDATSYNVDPRFIDPTGTSDTVDLHLQTVNPAEAKGVTGTGVTDDFDGQTRANYTATDIGADAGNFNYAASSTELNPLISFTPAANTHSTANRVLTGFATITDDVSVAGGGDAPRLYFKKSTEADAFVGNTTADNGWKYVTAGNSSSPFDFTIDYSLLTSSAGGGDVIQYFVVAQDGAANFASSPSGASYSSAAAPVTTINNRPATVQSYRILSTDLSALTLSSGTLAPNFAANLTTYTATVANSVSSLLVTPTPADSTATVTVNGSTPASPVGLSVGANTLTIIVTASDSTTKTYTATVTRADSSAPDMAVTQTSAVADGGSIDFGTVTIGSSSAAKTFTITNAGTGDLTGLSITGATSEFTVSALSGTSVPVGSGSVTFSVTFTPIASGTRTATLQIASNVTGAKNPYDIVLNGTGQTLYAAWAAANSVPMNDANLLRFAFGMNPVGPIGPLQYTGTLAGSGTLTATGEPVTLFEPSGNGVDFRSVFVRRKDYAAAGLSYTPQFSATLGLWQNSAAVPTVLADDGTHQIVSVPYPFFIAGKKARFFRIQVNLAP